jgi:peptide/nickel transport system permease protein
VKGARLLPWARANLSLVVGLACVAGVAFTAVMAPVLQTQDPTAQDLARRLLAPAWLGGSEASFVLGTDQLGRDVLSRILHGGRVSLVVGLAATLGSGILGIFLGLVAGYFKGALDTVIMSAADIQLALPFILLAIAVLAVVGPGLGNVVILLILTQWVVFARVVRAQVLTLEQAEFVTAARALGARDGRILHRHILPNTWGATLAIAIPRVSRMILAEAALSFLGLGVPPPTPTWGSMLSDSRPYLNQAPWITVFPGLAIVITVMGINLLGEWFRIRLDPKQQRK